MLNYPRFGINQKALKPLPNQKKFISKQKKITMKELLNQLQTRLDKIYKGGGEKAAAKQKEKGKMLARERVDYLLDKDTPSY
jgi:acetyl-CoA carboxylase carboxyltransferase component